MLKTMRVVHEPFGEAVSPLVTEALPLAFHLRRGARGSYLPCPKAVTLKLKAPLPGSFPRLGEESFAIETRGPTLSRIARLPASILQKHEAMQPGIMRCLDAGPVGLGKPFGWHVPIDGFCGGL